MVHGGGVILVAVARRRDNSGGRRRTNCPKQKGINMENKIKSVWKLNIKWGEGEPSFGGLVAAQQRDA